MKTIITSLFVGLVSSYVFSEVTLPKLPEPDKPLAEMTPEERKAYSDKRAAVLRSLTPEQQELHRQMVKDRVNERAGGLVRDIKDQKGRILVANAQIAVPAEALSSSVNRISGLFKISFEIEKCDPALKLNSRSAKEKNANAVIYMVDDASLPGFLVAPEERWAQVNVAPLRDGDVNERAKKQLVRAFCYLCGAASSQYPGTLLDAIESPRQLDGAPNAIPSDVLMRFPGYLSSLGITPYTEMTYRKACKLGLAPMPTNDFQKAIWQKIHSEKERGPTNPIKIAPPAKK